jgi:hypothetical protein
MTVPTISVTGSKVLAALRSFLLSVLPAGVEVIRGQDNRTPEPKGNDFIVMIPILRERLETNISTWTDGFFATPPVPGTRNDLQPTRVTIQLDIHGPNSADNTQIITTLFRSEVATAQFATSGFDVTPLYTSDPRQLPFFDGEQQYEDRWSVDAVMQANPIVTTAQDFAGSLRTGIIPADVTYPP